MGERSPTPAELNALYGKENEAEDNTRSPEKKKGRGRTPLSTVVKDPFDLPRGEEPEPGFNAFSMTSPKPPTVSAAVSPLTEKIEKYTRPLSKTMLRKQKADKAKLERWNKGV